MQSSEELRIQQEKLEAEATALEHELRMVRYFTQFHSENPVKVGVAISKYTSDLPTSQS